MLSKERLTHPLAIKKKIKETENTYSFVFDIPTELKDQFHYKAGQFVTLFVEPDGNEVRRSYSLSSSPDWNEDFKISVKSVPGGLVSNWLINNTKEGDIIHVTPPAGLFCLPKSKSSEFIFFAGGSGITPVISLIKSALKTVSNPKIRLLYCSRDEGLIIFKDELRSIQESYPKNFEIVHSLSTVNGRLAPAHVKDFLESSSFGKKAHYFLCGPEGLMVTVQAELESHGISREFIHRESFAVTTPHSDYIHAVGNDVVFIGDKSLAHNPEEISAELDGEWITIEAKEGVTVLETLLEAGHNPPYSCMDGACMACLGKVQQGLVYQEDMGILTADNTEIGECLTCQAIPASKKLKISYEI